jgi:hypothetical protein
MRISNRIAVALPLLVVAVLTAIGLPHWALWRAEMWTWMLVGLEFDGLMKKLAEDFHPPGYFVLLWALLETDYPDWVLRFPSLLGMVGTVGLAGVAARRWFGQAEGFFAAMALALSPFVLVYGGVARGYALLALAAAGLLVSGAQMVEGHRVRAAALGLLVSGTAAIYIHYAAGAALLATVLGIAAGLRARPDRGAGRWVWAVGAMAMIPVLFSPWLLGPMRNQQTDVSPLPRSLNVLGYLVWPVGHQQPLANWALLGIGALGVFLLLRRRTPADRLLLAWPLVGVVIPLVFSDRSDLQTKFYVESWFLPAWGVLVGVGTAAIVRHLASFRTGATVFVGVLVASAVGPLVSLWKLPAAPFEVWNGSNVYDVRREVRLLRQVLPDIPAGSFPTEPFSVYAAYMDEVPTTSRSPRWMFRRRDDVLMRSVYTAPELSPCTFPYAFYVTLSVPDPFQCDALVLGIQAAAEREAYPPFVLELASRAWMRGNLQEAEALAAQAAAMPNGWSDPAVFLAQLYAQNGQPQLALGSIEQALGQARIWKNYFVAKELFGLKAELLYQLGRIDEAQAAAACASPSARIEACLAE